MRCTIDVKRRQLDSTRSQVSNATSQTGGRGLPSHNPYAKSVSARAESHTSRSGDRSSTIGGNPSSRAEQKRSTNRKRKVQAQQEEEQARLQPPPLSSTTTSQYPHRVGKVRSSRDFGLSLRLSNTTATTTAASAAASLSPAGRPSAATGTAQPAYVTPAPNSTAPADRSVTMAAHHRSFVADDEDDDDDDSLLSFVAFGSSK